MFALFSHGIKPTRHISARLRACALATSACLVAVSLLSACAKENSSPPAVTIAAAASLRHVMPKLTKGYTDRYGAVGMVVTYGASGELRRQVESGAPIDLVVLASGRSVDRLVDGGFVDPTARRLVATNQLVIAAHSDTPRLTFESIDTLGAGMRFAIGDPRTVPAGMYAQEALETLGKWESIRDQLIFGGHVGAVLAYVRRREVDAAIVYRTELQGIPELVVLDSAAGPWAPIPDVVAGRTERAANTVHGDQFLDFLTSPYAQDLFRRYGFGPPAP